MKKARLLVIILKVAIVTTGLAVLAGLVGLVRERSTGYPSSPSLSPRPASSYLQRGPPSPQTSPLESEPITYLNELPLDRQSPEATPSPTPSPTATPTLYAGYPISTQKEKYDYLARLQPNGVAELEQAFLNRLYCTKSLTYFSPYEVTVTLRIPKGWCVYYSYDYTKLVVGEPRQPEDQRGWRLLKRQTVPGLEYDPPEQGRGLATTPAPPTPPAGYLPLQSRIAHNNFVRDDVVACYAALARLKDKITYDREGNPVIGEPTALRQINDSTYGSTTGHTTRGGTSPPADPTCGWKINIFEEGIHGRLVGPEAAPVNFPPVAANVAIQVKPLSALAIRKYDPTKLEPENPDGDGYVKWFKILEPTLNYPSHSNASPAEAFDRWVREEAEHVGLVLNKAATDAWQPAGTVDRKAVFDRYIQCVPAPSDSLNQFARWQETARKKFSAPPPSKKASIPEEVVETAPPAFDEGLLKGYFGGCRDEFQSGGRLRTTFEVNPRNLDARDGSNESSIAIPPESKGAKTFWAEGGAKVYLALKGSRIIEFRPDSRYLFFEQCRVNIWAEPSDKELANQCRLDAVRGADGLIDQLVTFGYVKDRRLRAKIRAWDKLHGEESEAIIKGLRINDQCIRPKRYKQQGLICDPERPAASPS